MSARGIPSVGQSAGAAASVASKENALRRIVRECDSMIVAYSGGVDSSLLCAVAVSELGERALAVTIDSPLLPRSELAAAIDCAAGLGLRHRVIAEPAIDPAIVLNPPDRCYHCKRKAFAGIRRLAESLGVAVVADGENTDDVGEYRPGSRAARELGVRSPLRDAGFTKEDIRALSRRLGLPNWDKPAFACLASRIPYGEIIDAPTLRRIERAEDCLKALGFRQYRVRSHGDIARIEVAREERSGFFDERLLDEVSAGLKALGFLYVCFELEGYATGSLDRTHERAPMKEQ